MPERVTSTTAPPESRPYSADKPVGDDVKLLDRFHRRHRRRHIVLVSGGYGNAVDIILGLGGPAAVDPKVRVCPSCSEVPLTFATNVANEGRFGHMPAVAECAGYR